jgi:hypothetical protein
MFVVHPIGRSVRLSLIWKDEKKKKKKKRVEKRERPENLEEIKKLQ